MNRIVAASVFALALVVLPALPALAQAEGSVSVQGGVSVGPSTHSPPPQQYRRRPGPRLMAPLRIDMGFMGANSTYGFLSGAEVSVGVHWASLSPTPTSFDIGIGALAGAMTNPNVPTTSNGYTYSGLYAELGQSLSRGDFWRTWASGRAEYLTAETFGTSRQGFGVSAKLEAELYLHGVGLAPNGIFLGSYALGVYVEAAARRLGDDVSLLQFGAGITIRTPLVWGW